MALTFYDAFHGVGGFRYGLEQAGMECVGGCEIDKYACQAYGVINNEECQPTDIRKLAPSEKNGTHGKMLVGVIGNRFPELIGQYLDPQFQEQLMGFPIGWSDVTDSETQ